MALNKCLLFFNRQVSQIHEGGKGVFYRKIETLLKLTVLPSLAPLTIFFKIDWPEAYHYMAIKSYKKLKKIHLQTHVDDNLIRDSQNKVIAYFEKYLAYKSSKMEMAQWIHANYLLNYLLFDQGKLKESIQVCQNVIELRSHMLKKHQLETLDIEFLPREFATGALGVYENLEAHIKAGILGLCKQKN